MTARSTLIPSFSEWRESIPQAMTDRAEMIIGDWGIFGEPSQIVRMIDALPGISAITRDGEAVPTFGQVSRSSSGQTVDVAVSRGRPGNVTYQTRPVFGGRLSHSYGEARVGAGARREHVRVGLESSLNLHHFLSAQPMPARFRLDRPIQISDFATAISEQFAQHGDEYCLTDETNLLLGSEALYRYALSKPAEAHLLDYISVVQDFLFSELRELAHAYGVRVAQFPYYSLRQIEFLWEFTHSHPVRFVEALELPMRALGLTERKHRALVRGEEIGSYQDSFSVQSELSTGCLLVAYAKTSKRVRFELRLNEYCIGRTLRSGRTANRMPQLEQMFLVLRVWATEQFQYALACLDRVRLPPPSGNTAVDLCTNVADVLRDPNLTRTVLETLRNRGSLASPLQSPMRNAADRLSAEGILRRSRSRSRTFVPTDAWVEAVGGLRRM